MKTLLIVPLLGLAALLTGCAVEPGYVGGPGYASRSVVYAERSPDYRYDGAYNDRGHGYHGGPVVVEESRRGRGDDYENRSSRERYRTSERRRTSDVNSSQANRRGSNGPARSRARNGGGRQSAPQPARPAKSGSHKHGDQKPEQH